MERKIVEKVGPWEIALNRNVHMYSHSLQAKKGNHTISIPCEDLPTEEETIGIWLYALEASPEIRQELSQVLLQWAQKFEVTFQIYTSKEHLLTNKQNA